MIDEIVLLLQQQQQEVKKLLNQHNREKAINLADYNGVKLWKI